MLILCKSGQRKKRYPLKLLQLLFKNQRRRKRKEMPNKKEISQKLMSSFLNNNSKSEREIKKVKNKLNSVQGHSPWLLKRERSYTILSKNS
jgi:hypothetical protein